MNTSALRNLKSYIFGSGAAIITNVSLIVGLGSARTGKGPILGGLLTIALADNISDALGFHLYNETERCRAEITALSTVLYFASRFVVSSSFIAVVLAFSVTLSIPISIVWGILLLTLISYIIAKSNGENSLREIAKHVLVAVIVIALSRIVGTLIAERF